MLCKLVRLDRLLSTKFDLTEIDRIDFNNNCTKEFKRNLDQPF